MNARRRCRLARTVLGHHQHGNIILRQFADHGFDGAHAGANAFEPEASAAVRRCSGSCQDFGSVETRYQHKNNEWIALTWRYDSGLVVSGVPDAGAAMIGGSAGISPNQQVSIGLACNGVFATAANPDR